MDSRVAGQFGMECGSNHVATPYQYRVPLGFGQDIDIRTYVLYPRCANEHRVERLRQTLHLQVDFMRIVLSTKGVAPHDGVDNTQQALMAPDDARGKENHPGARAEGR